ncbi:Ulp1 protease family [Forsythia ovata]|uniref:Ulp1 protease family n=1 Tax=Forsythia ovata TaxID=205694 RepID=A0ABD1WG09_9LAMI
MSIAKPVKNNVNIPVSEGQTLKAAKIVAQLEEKQQHYSHGLYDDSHVLRVEDSDIEFVSPLIRRPLSKSKKHAGDSSSSQTIIEVVKNTQIVTVDCHLNLEKTISNVSSHVININAKSVEEEDAHHKLSDNKFENAVKTIYNLTNFATNGCAEKMHKKECCFSKGSIMRSINALQSKHEQLVFDQFKMKMEIYNLFTDFAKSLVDGIETQTTIETIEDSKAGCPQGMSKKRRTVSEDIQSNNKLGNEINASAPISLLDDEIVYSEENFRHMDESVEKIRYRGQKRPAKTIRDVALLDVVEPLRQMMPHVLRHGDCGIFVIKFAEYIAENKIKEIPKNFDTKVALLNMATQLYKFACEKPYLNIFG